MQTSVSAKAGTVDRWKCQYPVLNDQKMYALAIASAPTARLITPEPR